MKAGDVAIAELPQVDGQWKLRPVVVLATLPPFRDYLICGITSQLRHFHSALDEIITPRDADFSGTGLRAESLVRGGYLMTYPPERFTGVIGDISTERLLRLLTELSNFLRPAQPFSL